MSGLKLARLPDRSPIKLALTIAPDLHNSLAEYAALYAETYGSAEPVADLIPAMLASFLESDREFARRRKTRVTAP